MTPLVVITSDLDQTLIFSRQASARLGGALAAEPVELVAGRTISEMALAVAAGLRALPAHTMFIPVTARTVAQLHRLRLPTESRYAVAACGGVVLVDDVPDPEWQRRIRRTSRRVASCDVAHLLLAALSDEPWIVRVARADDIFSYAIVDPLRVNHEQLAVLASKCAEIGWRSTLEGRKLYVLPADLSKSAAVAYILERIDSDHYHLAAGDSLLDRAMVCSAAQAWVPAGSPLAEATDLPPTVQITPRPGHEAAAHIVAGWAARASHFRPGVHLMPQL